LGLFALGLLLVYPLLCWQLAKSYLSPLVGDAGPVPKGLRAVDLPLKSGTQPTWTNVEPGEAPARGVTFVFAHGYGGDRGHWRELGAEMAHRGYGVVIPTLPGHRDVRDRTTGFGLKEAQRLKEVVDAIGQPKVVLVGVSMGGAACWLATEAGAKVDAVVTESAFANFEEAMNRWFSRKAPGAPVYLRPVVWFASSMSGLDPSQVVPVRAAEKWRGRPALVIQAGDDDLIDRSHAERLAAAADCPTWIVPGARHAQVAGVAMPEFAGRLEGVARMVGR